MTSVPSHVGGAGGMTGGPGRSAGGFHIGGARRSVSSNCGGPRCATRDFPTHPSSRSFDGLARPVILRMLRLKKWQHMLGTVGRPECQRPLLLPGEMLG